MGKHDLIWYLVGIAFLVLQSLASSKKKKRMLEKQASMTKKKKQPLKGSIVQPKSKQSSTGASIFGDFQNDWKEIFGGTDPFPATVQPVEVSEEKVIVQERPKLKREPLTRQGQKSPVSHFSHNESARHSRHTTSSSENLMNKKKKEHSTSKMGSFSINGLDDIKRAVVYSEILNKKYKL